MDALLQNAPQFLVVAGLALACYFLMRQGSWRAARRARENPLKQVRELLPEQSRDRALLNAPAEVVNWQVELHETARDLKAEIDTKLLALQALINLAREEREKLEAALERVKAVHDEVRSAGDLEQQQ